MTGHAWVTWVTFNVFVLAMLALDLGVFHRRAHEIKMKEALIWSAIWTVLALVFNAGVYVWRGPGSAMEFFTGYLIERALSVDNIFVFLLVFAHFGVPRAYRHRVLFWGILGALVMRAALIATGVTLIRRFAWVLYPFGAFLVLTGIKVAVAKGQEVHPERNPFLRMLRRFMPVSDSYEGQRFLVRRGGRTLATPLLVVLVFIETTDLVFALDSIPAILGITQDAFIVYSSNVFAILGLRALYFAFEGLAHMFQFLHYGVAVVLVFIGVKMLAHHFYKMPVGVALGVVGAILVISVLASVVGPRAAGERPPTA